MSADDGTTEGGGAGPGRRVTSLPSDPAAIEALIAERREALASTIDELVVRAHPKEIARRSAQDAQVKARSFAFTDDGQPRVERLAALAAAGIVLLGMMLLRRRRPYR
jgi:hypothetical protein